MNFFVLLLFTEGRSAPAPKFITDAMKSDKNLCDTIEFLYNSSYVKPCTSLLYPTAPWDLNETNVNVPLCLGVYDAAFKICRSFNRLQINGTTFKLDVEKFVPDKNQSVEFCYNLKGFTSTYTKIDSLWKPLINLLNSSKKCEKICFNLRDEINPLCVLLAWSKHITDIVNTMDLKYDHLMSHKLTSQANNETTNIINTEPKTSESKETKESSTKRTSNDNGNAESKLKNGNVLNTAVKSPDAQPNSYVGTSSDKDDIQKKNNTFTPVTQAPKAPPSVVSEKDVDKKIESIAEDTKPVNNPQTSSVKNPANENEKKYVDEDKMEEPNKDKDIEDVKSTTLSENTQEHYDVNPEDDINSAVDDNDGVEDSNLQPIDAGNQNENAQEPYEQKHSTQQFPGLRSDDSHFFTYFTVVTLACIVGYIGYHNKQKIFAIVLEGRRSRNSRGRRRPSTANYRKLDCTLEEAVTSQCNSNVTHVIY